MDNSKLSPLIKKDHRPKVSIVILNWNGLQHLKAFLPSVCATSYENFEIVVGDNNSSDGSVDFIKANYPEIKLIINEHNYGFAKGYNEILKNVDSVYYVILNSDVKVSGNWLSEIVDFMNNSPEVAACQPNIIDQKDPTKYEYAGAAGGFIDTLGYPFCRGRLFEAVEYIQDSYSNNKEVFWASGACFIIRSELFHEMGGFDPDFFAHQEEIDLCWRLKNKGYQVWSLGEVNVYHLGGGALNYGNPKKTFLNFRNNLILLTKNLCLMELLWKLPLRMLLDYVALFHFLFKGELKHAFAVIKAHNSFERSLIKHLKKRNGTQLRLRKHRGVFNGMIIVSYFLKGKKSYKALFNS